MNRESPKVEPQLADYINDFAIAEYLPVTTWAFLNFFLTNKSEAKRRPSGRRLSTVDV